jgi:hypothetical protein
MRLDCQISGVTTPRVLFRALGAHVEDSDRGSGASPHVRSGSIVLQKSARIGRLAKTGNYRIEAVASLNHHCAIAQELESMFPTQVLKILLQQYRSEAEVARLL